jgi:hypothetical protein
MYMVVSRVGMTLTAGGAPRGRLRSLGDLQRQYAAAPVVRLGPTMYSFSVGSLKGKIHRVDPESASWPRSFTENPAMKSLRVDPDSGSTLCILGLRLTHAVRAGAGGDGLATGRRDADWVNDGLITDVV